MNKRFLMVIILTLALGSVAACGDSNTVDVPSADDVKQAAEGAADMAGEAAESAADKAGEAAESAADKAGEAAESAGEAAAGALMAGLGKLTGFFGQWQSDTDVAVTGVQDRLDALKADPTLMDDPAWAADLQGELAKLRAAGEAASTEAAGVVDADLPAELAGTGQRLAGVGDDLVTLADDLDVALAAGDAEALTAGTDRLSAASDLVDLLNTDLTELAGDAMGAAAEGAADAVDKAGEVASDAAGAIGAGLDKLTSFLAGWRTDFDAAATGVQAQADLLKTDPTMVDDPAWQQGMNDALVSLRAMADAARGQAGDLVDGDLPEGMAGTGETLTALADELTAAADDFAAALEAGDADLVSAAAERLSEARSAIELLMTEIEAGVAAGSDAEEAQDTTEPTEEPAVPEPTAETVAPDALPATGAAGYR